MPVADAGRQGKKYLGVKSSFLQDNDQILEFIMHEGTFHARLAAAYLYARLARRLAPARARPVTGAPT